MRRSPMREAVAGALVGGVFAALLGLGSGIWLTMVNAAMGAIGLAALAVVIHVMWGWILGERGGGQGEPQPVTAGQPIDTGPLSMHDKRGPVPGAHAGAEAGRKIRV